MFSAAGWSPDQEAKSRRKAQLETWEVEDPPETGVDEGPRETGVAEGRQEAGVVEGRQEQSRQER